MLNKKVVLKAFVKERSDGTDNSASQVCGTDCWGLRVWPVWEIAEVEAEGCVRARCRKRCLEMVPLGEEKFFLRSPWYGAKDLWEALSGV